MCHAQREIWLHENKQRAPKLGSCRPAWHLATEACVCEEVAWQRGPSEKGGSWLCEARHLQGMAWDLGEPELEGMSSGDRPQGNRPRGRLYYGLLVPGSSFSSRTFTSWQLGHFIPKFGNKHTDIKMAMFSLWCGTVIVYLLPQGLRATGPLHMLFSLFGMAFSLPPHLFAWLSPPCHLLRCGLLRKSFSLFQVPFLQNPVLQLQTSMNCFCKEAGKDSS